MKKRLTAFVLLLISLTNASAQKIYFSDTTNIWHVVSYGFSGVNGVETIAEYYQYIGDTSINSISYHKLNAGDGTWNIPVGAIREDTILKKVYFRFITSGIQGDSADTAEHILYDYTLKVNDTFRMDHHSQHYISIVQSIDSTLISGKYYKVWHWMPQTGVAGFLGSSIEGIGNVNNPLWPVSSPFYFEEGYQLQCFSNRYGTPPFSPGISVSSGPFNVPTSPPLTHNFDNSTSCSLAVDNTPSDRNMAIIYPNPGGGDLQLKISLPLKDAKLVVYNATGEKTLSMDAGNKTSIGIGALLQVPGLYFYQLKDLQTMKTQSGKFIFQ